MMLRRKSSVYRCRQPLREAVSWNTVLTMHFDRIVVSLFVRLWVEICRARSVQLVSIRQPLREAVSWNTTPRQCCLSALTSASSWGCELKLHCCRCWLFLWMSASSWGCELKLFILSTTIEPISVSLFVRLWVEMLQFQKHQMCFLRQPLREAVSWNIYRKKAKKRMNRQPLREAVSWNVAT